MIELYICDVIIDDLEKIRETIPFNYTSIDEALVVARKSLDYGKFPLLIDIGDGNFLRRRDIADRLNLPHVHRLRR